MMISTSGRKILFGPIFLSIAITLVLLIPIDLLIETRILLFSRIFNGGGWIEIVILALYAALLTHIITRTNHISEWRSRYWRLFSGVFFTQFILGMTVSSLFLLTGKIHIPIPALIISGPLFRGEVSVMMYIFTGTLLVAGPGWCAHLCYFGPIDDVFAKTKSRVPDPKPSPYRWKFIALFASVSLPLIVRWVKTALWLPAALAIAFGAGGVLYSAVKSRKTGRMAHCTSWCPISAVTTMVGRIYQFRVRIDPNKCTFCGKCSSACRYGALDAVNIEKSMIGLNCTLCGDCLNSCDTGAIRFSFLGGRKNVWPWYAAIIIALHSSFLGLARI